MLTFAKAILSVLIFLLPYILVGLCWLASFAVFNYQQVVTHEVFYFCSVMYWLMFQWLLHMVVWAD